MTVAMWALRSASVLALPVHDSLIMPEGAWEAMRRSWPGFWAACGAVPELDAEG